MRSYEYDDQGNPRLIHERGAEFEVPRRGRRRETYVRRSFREWLIDSRLSFATWFGLVALAALLWCPLSRVL